jgi:hypothetical protein
MMRICRLCFRAGLALAIVIICTTIWQIADLASGARMDRLSQYLWPAIVIVNQITVLGWIRLARAMEQDRDRLMADRSAGPGSWCRRCQAQTKTMTGVCGHDSVCAACGRCPVCSGPYALGPHP